MQLRFFGAANTVTGSRFLVQHDGRSLLVDCAVSRHFQGLFKGQ